MNEEKIKEVLSKTNKNKISKKNRKNNFIFMEHLKHGFMHQMMFNDDTVTIPTYKGNKVDGKITSLNVFKPKGKLKISDIRYAKLTVPAEAISNIDLLLYVASHTKTKIVKPEFIDDNVSTKLIGIFIDVDIMRIALSNNTLGFRDICENNFSLLFYDLKNIYSLKLYNKKRKCIGYVMEGI